MQNDKGPIFLEKLKDMVEFLIPNYILEGKKPACDRNWMYRWEA